MAGGKINVGLLEGLSPNFTITVPPDTDLAFKGDSSLVVTGQSYLPLPNGAPLDFANREISYGKRRQPQIGQLRFNTSTDKMLVYNATGSSWDEVQSVGNFFINTISSYSGTGGNSATFNGSAYRFVLSNPGAVAEQHIVSVNGVIQKPTAGTSQPAEGFAIDGSSIIFSSAPASGSDYFIITIGSSVNIGTPSNNTVTSAMIVDGSIVNGDISSSAAIAGSKLANDSIAEVKLDISNEPADNKFLKVMADGTLSWQDPTDTTAVSYTHLRAHETPEHLVWPVRR